MKKKLKKINFSIFLSLSAFLLPPFFCSSILSSCSSKHKESDSQIRLYNTQQLLTKHSFTMPFAISSLPKSPICIQIINDSSKKISIDNQQIFLKSKDGKIEFQIDPNVDRDSHFHFGVEFLFINSNALFQKIEINDLDIYYKTESIEEVDEVECVTKSITQTNNREFDFKIQFYKWPKNKQARVHLLDDASGTILLNESTVYSVEQVPGHNIFFFNVPIKLALSECTTKGHRFSIEVIFINSFGMEQRTVISDLNAFLEVEPTEIIPSDYYNIKSEVVEGKTQQVLYGLKPEISREESARYSEMIIPDYVTVIAPGAFIDRKWFSKIDFIKIGANVSWIGQSAFVGCNNLFELDLSSNAIAASTWIKDSSTIFSDQKYNSGFVWFDDETNIEETMPYLQTKGIPSEWSAEQASKIIPDDFYEFDLEDPTKLIGIVEEKMFQLYKYDIIRLPRKTRIVLSHSLDAISNHPYILPEAEEENGYRRLLLHSNIAELHCLPRGIYGNVTFRCDSLEKFDDNIASNLSSYPDYEKWISSITYDFQWMSSLKEIGNKAFNDLGISGTIIIPESVTKIGTSAFYRTRMDKLIFAAPIEDLSTDVFCDSYSLRELDLSIYTSLPDWLSQHLNLFSIEYPQGLPPTTVFVNQHMSDDDLDQWATLLHDNQGAPIKDDPESSYSWTVARRPY